MLREVPLNNERKNYNELLNLELSKLIKKMDSIIKQEELKTKISKKITKIIESGNFIITENFFHGNYIDGEQTVSLDFEFMFDSIVSIVIKKDEQITNINYFEVSEGYEIEYSFPNSSVVEINGNIYNTEDNKKLIQKYDTFGNIVFDAAFVEEGNYFIEPEVEFQKVKSIS